VRVSADGVLPVDAAGAWSRLVAWERQTDWLADADDVRVLGRAREGVGVRIAVRTRVFGVPAFTEVLEVVRWEPPRLLQIAHTGFVRGAGTWRLDALGPDATRLSWTEELRLPLPVVGVIALRIYSPFLRRTMRRSIDALAREIGAPP
jgi:hypothetical protein